MSNYAKYDASVLKSFATPPPMVATPPKHLRMIDAELQKIEGIQVSINESFRLGAIQLEPMNQRIITSSGTLTWLDQTERKNGPDWGPIANLLRTTIKESGRTLQTQMVDLTKVAKVVDRRKVTRPAEDRVELVCRGIADLSAQMSGMLSGRVSHDENMVNGVAKRYATLAAEMAKLREALTNAEGMFEVAQIQVMQLMGGDD